VVLRYKSENSNANQILNELNMYKILGDIDCSAKIVYCYKNNEHMAFNEYLKRCNTHNMITQDMNYIIEKLDCGSKVFDIYKVDGKIDYTDFFTNLQIMLGRLVKSRVSADGIFIQGYYNTDIKPDNLGVVPKTKQLKMIDLDNEYVRKVYKPDTSNHYLIYMIFQVYAILNKSAENIDIIHTGITKKEYDDMINFIYGIANKGSDEEIEEEKYDACFMLSFYTDEQVKNEYNSNPRKYNRYRTILTDTKWFDRHITGSFYTLEMINPTKRKRTTNPKKLLHLNRKSSRKTHAPSVRPNPQIPSYVILYKKYYKNTASYVYEHTNTTFHSPLFFGGVRSVFLHILHHAL
jgi:hypothetical protein